MEQLVEFITNHWMLSTAFVVVLGALIFNLTQTGTRNSVSPQQAVRLINHENATVLDVRAEAEFTKGHIVDALNIPLAMLENNTKKLEKSKKYPLLVCCDVGTNSASAVRLLQKNAFDKVFLLKGGLNAWRQDNLPLTN